MAHIAEVSLTVVRPGDNTRITGIHDIVEPQVKLRGSGQVFLWILGSVEANGSGRSHRLLGMAAVATAALRGYREERAWERSAELIFGGNSYASH
jgi:glycine/sarcosine/betaine reductase component B subunit